MMDGPREMVLRIDCRKCGRLLMVGEFYAAPRNVLRHCRSSWCKPCTRANSRKARLTHPRRARGHNLARYGLTPDEFDAMLATQGGRCAICETDEPRGRHSTFNVDHNHETGVVRGLLCCDCNLSIGKLGDDPARLRAAADYLERAR